MYVRRLRRGGVTTWPRWMAVRSTSTWSAPHTASTNSSIADDPEAPLDPSRRKGEFSLAAPVRPISLELRIGSNDEEPSVPLGLGSVEGTPEFPNLRPGPKFFPEDYGIVRPVRLHLVNVTDTPANGVPVRSRAEPCADVDVLVRRRSHPNGSPDGHRSQPALSGARVPARPERRPHGNRRVHDRRRLELHRRIRPHRRPAANRPTGELLMTPGLNRIARATHVTVAVLISVTVSLSKGAPPALAADTTSTPLLVATRNILVYVDGDRRQTASAGADAGNYHLLGTLADGSVLVSYNDAGGSPSNRSHRN